MRTRIVVWVAVCAWLVVGCPTSAQQTTSGRSQHSEIVSILEPRIASRSSFERVELALAYFALGRVPSGEQQWEKAIASDLEIDNAVSHSNLGEQLLKSGALGDALPHLRRAYELDPQNATFRMDYDATRQRLGRGQ